MENEINQASFGVQQDYNNKKKELEEAFKQFHVLVKSKVLDKNKSPALKKTEMHTINNLIKASQALDNINIGEGILALASIAVREHLVLRDRVNELEWEFVKLLKEVRESKSGKAGNDKNK